MRGDWIDLKMDLAQLRERPTTRDGRVLELETAVENVKQAQLDIRLAANPTDEELARHHLNLAVGHLAKLTKLHGGVDTWVPKKPKQPKTRSAVPDIASARRLHMARPQYRGQSERRFRGVGAEQRQQGIRRPLEIRNLAGGTGSLVQVEGEPIRYNAPYTVVDRFGEFEETMRPGVAAHLVRTADCRFLFGHDGLPLARTKAGTMRLHDTAEALRFTATVDIRSSQANDLIVAIERGDVSQMSVGFVVDEGGDAWSNDLTKRSISRFRSLEDVSAVTYPASPSTSIALAGAGMGGRV